MVVMPRRPAKGARSVFFATIAARAAAASSALSCARSASELSSTSTCPATTSSPERNRTERTSPATSLVISTPRSALKLPTASSVGCQSEYSAGAALTVSSGAAFWVSALRIMYDLKRLKPTSSPSRAPAASSTTMKRRLIRDRGAAASRRSIGPAGLPVRVSSSTDSTLTGRSCQPGGRATLAARRRVVAKGRHRTDSRACLQCPNRGRWPRAASGARHFEREIPPGPFAVRGALEGEFDPRAGCGSRRIEVGDMEPEAAVARLPVRDRAPAVRAPPYARGLIQRHGERCARRQSAHGRRLRPDDAGDGGPASLVSRPHGGGTIDRPAELARDGELHEFGVGPGKRHRRAAGAAPEEPERRNICGIPCLLGQHAASRAHVHHRREMRQRIAAGDELVMAALPREQRPYPAPPAAVVGGAVFMLPVAVGGVAIPADARRQLDAQQRI